MEKLNNIASSSSNYVKLSELAQNVPIHIKELKFVESRFGRQLAAKLLNDKLVFLPERFKTIEQALLDEINNKENFFMLYKGMKQIGGGKTMHILEFHE